MRKDISFTKHDDDDGAWREIEELVDEVSLLARQPMSNRDFYVELLRRLMQATGAKSSGAWTPRPDGQLHREYRTTSGSAQPLDDATMTALQASLSAIAARATPCVLAPHASSDNFAENPTPHLFFAHPITIESQTVAVVELLHGDDASPTEVKGVEELLAIFADVAREFHRERQLRELRSREQAWTELDGFAEKVHQTLDWRGTCYAIANESARVTGCDRVSVLASSRVIAVSGIDTVNRRSNAIRSLASLARMVGRTGEALWQPDDEETLAPQLERRLEIYRDNTHVRAVAIVPLRSPDAKRARSNSPGMLVFERFDGAPWTDAQRRRIDTVCRHASAAMHNAAELSALPLLWLSRLAQALLRPLGLRHLPKTTIALALLVGAGVALCKVPGDFVIEGRGELRPAVRRHVFAPADGVIEVAKVEHADQVDEGDELLRLRHADLDFKMASVLGELQTNQKRFDTVHATRLNYARLNSDTTAEFDDLTVEEERLGTLIASLTKQKEILARQVAELTLKSPIDGEVLTWGVEDTLQSRAVRRGERLLTVAATKGEWSLEMWIADHDVEHVLRALQQDSQLMVSFVLASRSGETYEGRVEDVGMTTETQADGRPGVRVVVAFDRKQLRALRPGTTAYGKIHCGREPIGYIWFRELFEVVQTRLLF